MAWTTRRGFRLFTISIDIYDTYYYKQRMAHCNQCGYDWRPDVAMPKVCTKCKRYDWNEPKKGVGHGHSRVDEQHAGSAVGGVGDGASLSVLSKAKGTAKRLRPVPEVRDKLAGRGRPDPRPEDRPVQGGGEAGHENHRVLPNGDKRWCSDCKVNF